jgi:hypothetical protein
MMFLWGISVLKGGDEKGENTVSGKFFPRNVWLKIVNYQPRFFTIVKSFRPL